MTFIVHRTKYRGTHLALFSSPLAFVVTESPITQHTYFPGFQHKRTFLKTVVACLDRVQLR